jgi:hypothetical protein
MLSKGFVNDLKSLMKLKTYYIWTAAKKAM